MTDFNKVRSYYQNFDEDNRLSKDYSGRLEYDQTVKILKRYLPPEANILDLGGASGTYSFFLSELGYNIWLADLSEHLIEIAVEKNKSSKNKLKSLDVVNAVDLSIYPSESFDVILLFGPLYHLTEYNERKKCIREIYRVLKKDGFVFASFIPYLSGSRAIIDRYFEHSEQVNEKTLSNVFQTGHFHNLSASGFQEGYYPDSQEIQDLFSENHFEKIEIISIRGIAYEKEEQLYSLQNTPMYDKIMQLIDMTARRKEIIETCGHAMYIGKKCYNFSQ